MASASEIWSTYKSGDIDTRMARAKKVMDSSGNDHMSSIIGKIQTGREVRKGFKELKRKSAARKGMKTAKARKNAGPQMQHKKGR